MYIKFLSPIVHNLAMMVLRSTGEELIQHDTTAYDILEGKQIRLLQLLEGVLQPMRDFGLPIPAIGMGNIKVYNSTFGFGQMIKTMKVGPFEEYRRSGNGHLATHFYSFQGSVWVFQGYSTIQRLELFFSLDLSPIMDRRATISTAVKVFSSAGM